MHGEEVGALQNPAVVAAYLVVAGVLFACSRLAHTVPGTVKDEESEGAAAHGGPELEMAE
jgi:hypothetical protein